MIVTAYILFVTIGWLALCIYLLINSGKVVYLRDIPVSPALTEPSVAIIIAVKDEEAELEQALMSVCRLDYGNYRVLVVDDRSADTTPAILKRIAALNPMISVITIKDLPAGWLGKNHALYQGYCSSSEEYLLFTDGDVTFGPQALKKAMHYVMAKNLDHLAVIPQVTSRSGLFRSVVSTFALMLEIRHRPWDIADSRSDASIGVGAFNLVRRTAYEKAGTHMAISLRPDDDLKLGERIKKANLRSDAAYGKDEISLEWYTSLAEFIKGLMKNTYSVSNYHLATACGMAFMTFLAFVLPLPVMLLSGTDGLIMAMVVLLCQVILMQYKKGIGGKWWHAGMIPFAGAVMVYIIIKSAILTIQRGGIWWRNTFYSLKELKRQR